MASRLSAIIIGRIGQDATVKTLESGWKVINFSVAHGIKSKNASGEMQEQTTWVGVAYWIGKDREDKLSQYLTKGTLVSVEGYPSAEGWWSENDSAVRTQLRIKSERLDILHRPNGNTTNENSAAPAAQTSAPAAEKFPPINPNAQSDDDLPF